MHPFFSEKQLSRTYCQPPTIDFFAIVVNVYEFQHRLTDITQVLTKSPRGPPTTQGSNFPGLTTDAVPQRRDARNRSLNPEKIFIPLTPRLRILRERTIRCP